MSHRIWLGFFECLYEVLTDCVTVVDLRKLGYSMRVERSTVDQVKNRLQSASKRKWDPLMIKKLDAMEGS